MAEKATCFVTTSLEGKGAYAIRADTDQNVYVPVGVAEALELEELEEITILMVKNDRVDPPWRAIRVQRPTKD